MLIACSAKATQKNIETGATAATQTEATVATQTENKLQTYKTLTVNTIDNGVLIASDENNELYRVNDCSEKLEPGGEIGVSYRSEEKDNTGTHVLTDVEIKKEGSQNPAILAPTE